MGRKSNNEGSIRQRKDGRWEARATGGINYATGEKQRISVYGKTKAEVIKKLQALEYEIHHKQMIDPTSIRLVDWIAFWLENYKKNSVKQTTFVGYHSNLVRHVTNAFPSMKLKDLTTRDLQQFYNYKLSVEGLSLKTVINIHRWLHAALKQAVKERYLMFNPSDAVVLPKCEKPEIDILTCDEQDKLWAVSYQFRYGIFVRLALTTGMRFGEILGLKWENVDLRKGELFVRMSLSRLEKIDYNGVGAKTEIIFQTPKTKNSIRSIPLMPFVINELKEWRNIQLADMAQAGAAYQDMGLVVTNPSGGWIEEKTFSKYYHKMLEECGVGHHTFHALRHTFCTRALENGMDAKTISSIMGHATVGFTLDTYGHVLDKHKREEIMKMANIYSIPTQPQQQSYPVIVTPTMNKFIFNVVDFEDMDIEANDIQNGLACIQKAISTKLIGIIPPTPTPYQDLIPNAGEFVVMVTI